LRTNLKSDALEEPVTHPPFFCCRKKKTLSSGMSPFAPRLNGFFSLPAPARFSGLWWWGRLRLSSDRLYLHIAPGLFFFFRYILAFHFFCFRYYMLAGKFFI